MAHLAFYSGIENLLLDNFNFVLVVHAWHRLSKLISALT